MDSSLYTVAFIGFTEFSEFTDSLNYGGKSRIECDDIEKCQPSEI